MDIRALLLQRLHNSTPEQLKGIIDEGIASKEETILPGLGVLFEEYYKSLSNKESLLNSLSDILK